MRGWLVRSLARPYSAWARQSNLPMPRFLDTAMVVGLSVGRKWRQKYLFLDRQIQATRDSSQGALADQSFGRFLPCLRERFQVL